MGYNKVLYCALYYFSLMLMIYTYALSSQETFYLLMTQISFSLTKMLIIVIISEVVKWKKHTNVVSNKISKSIQQVY